tara:strand:+ start:181 stop:534 length:354 start_codon:yes stop_codon:yes gene_type:complete
MAIYKNIVTEADGHITSLIAIQTTKGSLASGTYTGNDGDIRSIQITNADVLDALGIDVYIEAADGTKFYYIQGITIPVAASLVLNDSISFDATKYALKILTNEASDDTAPNISVIIK